MPLNGAQLSEMVNRARLKAPPVISSTAAPIASTAAQTATPAHGYIARPN